MQSAFDIAADLDTPVSAYLKLAPFQPRFLLESVEGGERLGRYSFIGFGDSMEFRLTGDTYWVNGDSAPAPKTSDGLLNVLREALDRAPKPGPEIPGLPFAGGLVGTTAFEMNKRFENIGATSEMEWARAGYDFRARPVTHARALAARAPAVREPTGAHALARDSQRRSRTRSATGGTANARRRRRRRRDRRSARPPR